MNKKIINKAIRRKMNDWLSTIEDISLIKDIERDLIVTGGCLASMLLGEDVNDYDVYFKTKETAKKVANYYVGRFNEKNQNHKNMLGHFAKAFVLDGIDVEQFNKGALRIEDFASGFENQPTLTRMIAGCAPDRIKIIVRSDGVAAEDGIQNVLEEPIENIVDLIGEADSIPSSELDEKEKYRPVFLSTNAITLSDSIQIVIRFYGEAKDIHENYDFAHCTNYWTFDESVVLRQEALESLMSKQLFYQGSKYPLCSVIRTRKFIKRGWHINAGQYLKMCFQISNLDLTNIDVLEDQLVGVDSAYFMHLIDGLRSKSENDPNFKVEEHYVTSIIDKIF